MEPLELTASQKFEIEKFSRIIDATEDIAALKIIAKQLLHVWMTQKAATVWVMKQALPIPPICHD